MSRQVAALIAGLLLPAVAAPVLARSLDGRPADARQIEEVIVTARKREQRLGEVPVSLTAYDSNELADLKIRDLTRLSMGIPGVLLDDVGTRRGTANFSIRGLGINSSIPSIDPAVGLFVNGVYIALNNDTLFDVFDLERVEVLRGPQGVLFGRNVTGGAVLMQTRRPGKTTNISLRSAIEAGGDGGLSRYLSGAFGGPITDRLQGRIALHLNDDQGWFENRFDGSDQGAIRQEQGRASLAWQPDDRTDVFLSYERGDIDGEGPAVQSHENGAGIPGSPLSFSRNSFDFSNDEAGYQEVSWDFVTLQVDRAVPWGEGTVSNVFGWRDQSSEAMSDIDGQPVFLFHSPGWVDHEQWSNELRYQGALTERTQLTLGAYWLHADLAYHDRRLFLGDSAGVATATQDGGGLQSLETRAAFGAVDIALSDRWALNAGLRASREEKSVRVASFNLNPTPCNIVEDGDCPFDFVDEAQFDTLAPTLGLSYAPSAGWLFWGHWTRAFRSGGYNLRNSNAAEAPGPYGEEQVDSVELGLRGGADGWQLDLAAFATRVDDMQREVNLPSASAGILQLVRNTAEARLIGVEADAKLRLAEGLWLNGSLAYLDAAYEDVRFDIDGDGVVTGADRKLELPRAPEWTGAIGLEYTMESRLGEFRLRGNYAYRDRVAYTDNNLGWINNQRLLDFDASVALGDDGRWLLSAYARNALNEVRHGGDSQLPATFIGQPLGGTFAPLTRGRIIGVSVALRALP